MGEFEQEIPGSGGQSIGTIGFDMTCDGTREYVSKMFKPSKIDQVLNFYGIPFLYKNEYKKYFKYRIQPRHYGVVNDYFSVVLRQEGYDTSDFDFGKLQDEYNIAVPEAEPTGLDLHINYDEFIKNDKAHQEAVKKQSDSKKDEQIENMQNMMKQMMEQMQTLQGQVGNKVLLSNEKNNEGTTPSGSDNGSNATNETITPHEDEKDGSVKGTGAAYSNGTKGSEGIDQGTEGSELIGGDATKGSDINTISGADQGVKGVFKV